MEDPVEGERHTRVVVLEASADVQKSAIVVNGQTPGPLITGNKGDSVQKRQSNAMEP